jgi:hypothetical protein
MSHRQDNKFGLVDERCYTIVDMRQDMDIGDEVSFAGTE